MSETGASGRALPIATLVAIVWLIAAGAALILEQGPPASLAELSIRGALETTALLLAPVAAFFALAAAIMVRGTTAMAAPTTPEGMREADVAGTLVRLSALREGLAEDAGQLAQHGRALEEQSTTARAAAGEMAEMVAAISGAAQQLLSAFSAADDQATRLRQSLSDFHQQAQADVESVAQATDRLETGLRTAAETGASASAALTAELERLAAAATDGRTRSEAGLKTIRAEADQLFELLENGLTARRDTLKRRGEDLSQQLEDGWKRFEAATQTTTAKVQQQFELLSGLAERIGNQLAAQIAASENLAISSERSFQLLDARLAHSGQSMDGALDRLSDRIAAVNTDLAGLTAPMKAGAAESQALGSSVAALRESVLQLVDIFGQTLPEKAVEASRTADTLRAEIGSLVESVDQLHRRAGALADPLRDGQAAIDAASAAFATQRETLETAGQALVVELNQAQQLITEVEDQTRETSLMAATRLVEALSRVREVATQATGTMRTMLDGLIDEARESLSATAGEVLQTSFVTPITEKTREAEAMAATAAERTAQSMAALAQTLKLVDDHAQTRLATLESERQAELLASSALLRERLDAAGADLLAALDRPMSDEEWAQWRKGERGLFNRRTLGLLERRESRDLRALLDADPELKAMAQRYSADFAALVTRLPALASALQSSEQGRIAAILHEALDG